MSLMTTSGPLSIYFGGVSSKSSDDESVLPTTIVSPERLATVLLPYIAPLIVKHEPVQFTRITEAPPLSVASQFPLYLGGQVLSIRVEENLIKRFVVLTGLNPITAATLGQSVYIEYALPPSWVAYNDGSSQSSNGYMHGAAIWPDKGVVIWIPEAGTGFVEIEGRFAAQTFLFTVRSSALVGATFIPSGCCEFSGYFTQ